MYLIDSHFIAGVGQLRDVTCKNYRLQLKICCCEVQRQPLGIVSLCGEFSPPLRQVRFILQQKINEARCWMRRNTLAIAPVPRSKPYLLFYRSLYHLCAILLPSAYYACTIPSTIIKNSVWPSWHCPSGIFVPSLLPSLYPPTTACPASVDHPFTIRVASSPFTMCHPCTIFAPPFTTLRRIHAPSLNHHFYIFAILAPSSYHLLLPFLHHPVTIF